MALPEILRLISSIQKNTGNIKNEMQLNRRLKDEVKTINEAIATNNPRLLDELFNNKEQ